MEPQYLKPKDREHDSYSNQKLPSHPASKKSAQFIHLFLSCGIADFRTLPLKKNSEILLLHSGIIVVLSNN